MSLRQLFYPSRCIFCGVHLHQSSKMIRICGDCLSRLMQNQDSVRQLSPTLKCVAAVHYAATRQAILQYKFKRRTVNAETFGNMMVLAWRRHADGDRPDAITWVPISTWRKFIRGYDQSYLLAKVVAERLALPLVPMLFRIRHTEIQSRQISDESRYRNMSGVFSAYNSCRQYTHVLLIDDIVTSGATISSAASALQEKGISCTALCFANARY